MTLFKHLTLLSKTYLITLLILCNTSVWAEEENEGEWLVSEAKLEQMLAPIALYPDTVLSHILVASTYPLEVVQAERWVIKNAELQGRDAVEAAAGNDWDPSVQALVAFPEILKRMSQDLEWTQRLGEVFIVDEEAVLDSVQNLRELAEEAGSLDEMEKVTVSRDDRIIVIEPREREVVYVPYYDTRIVYGPWRWRNYQPIYWDYPYVDSPYYNDFYTHNPRNSFFWGPRISLSFDFFSNTFHWRNRHIVRISSRHYRPHQYYGHYDIVGHRHAERWVHDTRRRHGHRNRHFVSRDHEARNHGRSSRDNSRVRNSQQRQAEIRSHLGNRSSRVDDSNRERSSSGLQNSTAARSTRVTSANPTRVETYPTRDSRIVLPNRARPIEDVRRPINRPSVRQTPVQRQVNRPVNTQTQQRQITQPSSQTRVSRPTPVPKAVRAETRPAPKRAQATTRTERRQPR